VRALHAVGVTIPMILSAIAAAGRGPASGDVRWFDIGMVPLSRALVTVGLQGGVSVAGTDPILAQRRLRAPIRGRMTVEQALARLLAGTGLVAVRTASEVYRIERAPHVVDPAPPPPRHDPPPPPVVGAEIVVMASKRGVPIDGYPGYAHMLTADDLTIGSGGHADTRALANLLPVLTTTSLGPGREKLFVRGIADSSFVGGSQATVGQYLGEVQLNYSAPDPNLALYDIASVELLEGPQGTLYGTGALGGVMRVTPKPPELGRWSGAVGLGATGIAHGGAGGDAMAVLNAPMGDSVALRILSYGSRTPGYIDDTLRGGKGVNRSDVGGGRATLRIRPSDVWTIDIGGVYQRIDNRDAQYVDGAAPPLTRAVPVAEPSSNDFRMGSVTVQRRSAGGQTLTAALSLVRNNVMARYDAAGLVRDATALETASSSRVLTGELRLARHRDSGNGFVLGSYATVSDDWLTHSTVGRDGGTVLRGIGNRVVDVALFGEATLALGHGLMATMGLRATYLDFSGTTILPGGREQGLAVEVPNGGDVTFLPSAALRWDWKPGLTGYLRYQRGLRVGGYGLDTEMSVDPDDISPDDGYVVFRPDTLDTIEAGLRFGDPASRFHGQTALSFASWRSIQADLYGMAGPHTTNIGDGQVWSLETTAQWRPAWNIRLTGALVLTRSVLTDPAPPFVRGRQQALPNTPAVSTRVALDRRWSLATGDDLLLRGSVRYAGRSWVGVGPLHLPQGDYAQADMGLAWTHRHRTLTLDVSNLLDVAGNRFAVGNPLAYMRRTQWTPLQPRTIRIGAAWSL